MKDNKFMTKEFFTTIASLLIGAFGLFGVQVDDQQGFTDAVVAIVSGVVMVVTGVTFIIAQIDLKKKALDNKSQV